MIDGKWCAAGLKNIYGLGGGKDRVGLVKVWDGVVENLGGEVQGRMRWVRVYREAKVGAESWGMKVKFVENVGRNWERMVMGMHC